MVHVYTQQNIQILYYYNLKKISPVTWRWNSRRWHFSTCSCLHRRGRPA